jgi:AAHS family 4-hydroxybenzoate transporter-like MFS transporter
MSVAATVDISEAIESRKLGVFAVRLIVVSWLVTFFDGFDMNVIAFTSKYLQRAFELDAKALGNLFACGIAGTLLGGFAFGFLGDKLGRRPAILLATGAFSVLTLLTALVQSYHALMLLRFVNGLALGGVLPLIWALNVEFTPKKSRATVITLIMLGYGLGTALSGPVARYLLPKYDWPSVFIFGGCASVVATVLLAFSLPESLRYLAAKDRRPDLIAKVLRQMKVAIPPADRIRYVLSDEDNRSKARFHVKQLFEGRLAWLTPLLWAAYFASSMSTFFISSWGPFVLEGLGFNPDHAAYISSVNSLCSATGGLLLMRFTDRFGPIAVAVLPLIAIPLLLTAGLAPISLSVFLIFSVSIAIFLGGSHYGIISIVSLFYPSAIRANGAGWVSSIAKFGSVIGPLIGGYVLSSNLPVRNIYALLAVCPTIYATCVLTIGLLERRERRAAARSLALAGAVHAGE